MRALHFVLSMSLTISGIPAWAAGESGGSDPCGRVKQQCIENGRRVDVLDQAGMLTVALTQKESLNGQADDAAKASSAACSNYTSVAEFCGKLKDKCKASCGKDTKKVKACEESLAKLVQDITSQGAERCRNADGFRKSADASNMGAASSNDAGATGGAGGGPGSGAAGGGSGGGSSGGGLGSMGSGLLGALAGAAGGFLIGKQMGKKEERDALLGSNGGALQANGTLDCSKADAYTYQACNDYLSNACTAKVTDKTYASDVNCVNFGNRFCLTTSSTSTVPTTSVSVLGGAAPPPGVQGEGIGTGFCRSVVAVAYCQTSGRESCPSCLALAKAQSPSCVANPALCVAQNSPDQISAARTSCPTDPAFSDPTYVNGGAAISAGLNTTTGAGLPAVVLPPADGVSSSSAALPAVTTASASNLQAASVGAVREELSAGVDSLKSSGSGSAAGFASAGAVGPAVAAKGTDRVASASESVASPARGPASDVQTEYGPSLFAMSSQIIRSRCQSGKLNCP